MHVEGTARALGRAHIIILLKSSSILKNKLTNITKHVFN